MALKEGVMSQLRYVNSEPMPLVLTVLGPNLARSLWVLACPEVHHTAHSHDYDYDDNVKGKQFLAPLV